MGRVAHLVSWHTPGKSVVSRGEFGAGRTLRLEDVDGREVSVEQVEVEPVTDDEFVGDVESLVGDGYWRDSPLLLVEEDEALERFCLWRCTWSKRKDVVSPVSMMSSTIKTSRPVPSMVRFLSRSRMTGRWRL